MIRKLRRRLKRARERLWDRIRRRHNAPRGSPLRAYFAKRVRQARRFKDKTKRALKRAKQTAQALPGPPSWGGCRQVTNEIIRIVDGRAPVTSRKRVELFGNPGSDHHVSQVNADAVDFGIGEAHSLADEIGHKLGIGAVSDFATYFLTRRGRRYRVQPIAATHGTGPHLHWGVRRA